MIPLHLRCWRRRWAVDQCELHKARRLNGACPEEQPIRADGLVQGEDGVLGGLISNRNGAFPWKPERRRQAVVDGLVGKDSVAGSVADSAPTEPPLATIPRLISLRASRRLLVADDLDCGLGGAVEIAAPVREPRRRADIAPGRRGLPD